MNSNNHYVYAFEEGDGKNKMLLGGKGANLCEMTQIGLNVPPGFTITTEACLKYLENSDRVLPEGLMDEVRGQLNKLEEKSKKGFGSSENPLLVSVRSGSAMSMPGMMDTILNLGLNEITLQALIAKTGSERFGYDAYRRFIQLFGKVALGVPDEVFDEVFESIKNQSGASADVDLSAKDLREISEGFLDAVKKVTGKAFPEDPYVQLELAVKAVFSSWTGKRAVDYRKEFHITPEMANGTAVNVVAMVFGNLGDDCATGVGFTRYPDSGENRMFGEYLVNAQGEDVVAGIRTPKPIDALEQEMPEMYSQLTELRNKLESHYKEVQDFEFTIENKRLYCLQTRNGKMNAIAQVRTSVEMVREGLISKEQALLRIQPEVLEQLLFPRLDPGAGAIPVARGLSASPGAASGLAVFDADRAEHLGQLGQNVILVREETKPEDIHGFFASKGILTSRGGKTSHAAVVARGMGKPCVAGAEGIHVDVRTRKAVIGDHIIKEGDMITIDGSSGDVYPGEVPMIEAEFSSDLEILLQWADEKSLLTVMANADTPEAAKKAKKYGASGIGLCRTERMFNDTDRLPIVIDMIVADSIEKRQAALDRLLPIQRADFKAILKVMSPNTVTIRLLDPPIHEFLPSENQLEEELVHLRKLKNVVQGMDILSDAVKFMHRESPNQQQIGFLTESNFIDQVIESKEILLKKVRSLHEVNPMLGHRGVRLGITFPEIYSMQIRAILEAAAEAASEGYKVFPEIMVPQVCTSRELEMVKSYVDRIYPAVEAQYGEKVSFKFGSMLEVVRACMRAESLADVAEFFSFGTNDLSQAVFSFSREDAENKFLPMYNETGVLQDNPFEVLDEKGVGRLMELAVEWGRKVRPDMKFGICGEHGGHPQSIEFCHRIGLTYVSCSGPRVPTARLAAAQAALKEKLQKN
ncbi:MAG: pyruvate, phosphate dikinase [Spirochaetia bacterium]|nr:pyruvate, phosphate dikinase [Spirochaetia bacterium]